MSPLFRPEALAHRQQGWLGPIRLSRPPGLGRWTVALALLVLPGLAWLMVQDVPRIQRLSGQLMPDQGLIRVLPGRAGALQDWVVREGQTLAAGALLGTLQLDDARPASGARAALSDSFDTRLRSLDHDMAQVAQEQRSRLAALQARLQAARSERAALEAQHQWQRQRQALADQAVARLEALRAAQFVSDAQWQARREEQAGLRAEGQALERQHQTLLRELAALEGELRELPLQSARRLGELGRERAEVAELAARAEGQTGRQELPLRVPVASVVTALHLQPGQAVAADQPVASLTPVGARWQAWLMAPASSLGGLVAGQPVALRLASFPFQQHGLQRGRVLSIARAPMSPGERAAAWVGSGAASSGSEPMYRVTVALDTQTLAVAGQPRELTAGMPLQADVVLERRRLLDRLLDPLRPTWQRLSE